MKSGLIPLFFWCGVIVGMEHDPDVKLKTTVLQVIDEHRKATKFDAALVPGGLNDEEHGYVVQYNPQNNIACTHLGGMYCYRTDKNENNNENGAWIKIREGEYRNPQQFLDDIHTHDFSHQGITSHKNVEFHVHRNFFPRYAYCDKSGVLVYSTHKDPALRRTIAVRERAKPGHIVVRYSTMVTFEQENKVLSTYDVGKATHDYEVASFVFSNDGLYCACLIGSKSDRKVRSQSACFRIKCFKKGKDNIYSGDDPYNALTEGNNELSKEFDIANHAPSWCWSDQVDRDGIWFKGDHLNIVVKKANGDHWHWVMSPAYGASCYKIGFDGDKGINNNVVFLSLYPGLYKKLKDKPYGWRSEDERIPLAITALEQGELPKEIRQSILYTWSYADEELRKQSSLVYGGDDSVFPKQEKRALSVLYDAKKIAFVNRVKKYATDDLWNAVKYGHLWGGYFRELLSYVFDSTCELPPFMLKRKKELKVGELVVNPNGAVMFNYCMPYDGTINRRYQQVLDSFVERYYKDTLNMHDNECFTQEHAQNYINDHTFKSAEVNDDGTEIKVALKNDSCFTVSKIMTNESLPWPVFEWKPGAYDSGYWQSRHDLRSLKEIEQELDELDCT